MLKLRLNLVLFLGQILLHILCFIFSDVKLLESCTMTRLHAHYESCKVTTSVPEYGLSMVVDHQDDFFPEHETQLHTCK